MHNVMKKLVSLFLVSTFLLFSIPVFADNGSELRFSDVPRGHWADEAIHGLRSLGVIKGRENNMFGMGQKISRSEFVAYLVRLMKWDPVRPEKGSFIDNQDKNKWYYPDIETALKNGVITESGGRFRPDDPITREEMAIMIVNALGFGPLAGELDYLGSSFTDVSRNTGYITIAKDFGIITGVGGNLFKPYDTAKREEAAAMMMRMYERLSKPISELHAFYAISSYSQKEMIPFLDSVSFGWSRLEYDEDNRKVVLNTARNSNLGFNEYGIPDGFSEPLDMARENNVSAQLMIAVKDETVPGTEGETGIPLLEYILTKPLVRNQVIADIVKQVNKTSKDGITVSFDGVVIDFEMLKGDILKKSFNTFLKRLRQELDKGGKKLYVAVHPKMRPGQEYYDGYDYRTIGEVADKVILMAHDYYAKTLTDADMKNGHTITPLTPIAEVYYALQAITDKNSGVQDLSKIWLQISFDSVLWRLKDGEITNKNAINLDYESVYQVLLAAGEMNFSDLYQNPYVKYTDSANGTQNVLWYEDSRSVMAKIKLARMFGVKGVSLWRLGNVPDKKDRGKKLYLDVWQQLLDNVEKNN